MSDEYLQSTDADVFPDLNTTREVSHVCRLHCKQSGKYGAKHFPVLSVVSCLIEEECVFV